MLLQMPIFSHANYMPTILKLLNAPTYSDKYLQMLEDLVVQQTQLFLGLPLDPSMMNDKMNGIK